MEDDGGDGGTGLGNDFAGVIGDGAELHSGGNVGAAFDEGIPDAGAVGEDINEFFDPDWIFDRMRIAGEHFQGAHGAESAVDEEGEVVGVDGAGVAGFDNDRRLAADGSGVIEIAGGRGVGGAFAPDDDVIEAEGEDHFLRGAVLGFAAGGAPVGVRAEALVEVAAVVVDEVVAAVDDFLGDEVRGALGLGAVGFAGIKAVHAFVVDGIDVGNFLFERLDVDERDEDYGAGNLGGVENGDEFFDGDDGDVFGAVSAGDEREDFAGLGAVDDDDRDAGSGVDTGRNCESAGGFFAGRGGGGADGEAGLGASSAATDESQKKQDKNRMTQTHRAPPRGM